MRKGRQLPAGTTEHLGIPIAVWRTLTRREKANVRTRFNAVRSRRKRDERGARKRGIPVERYAAMTQSDRIKWTRRKNGTHAGSCGTLAKWIRQSIQQLKEAGGLSADERQRWNEYRKNNVDNTTN